MPDNKFQPLNDHLVQVVRNKKPSEAMVPAKFARYEVDDLFQRFEVTGLTDKGVLASGIANVGWEGEIGWTGELDLAVFLPAGTVVGQLQPKLTAGFSKTASSILIMQRLPKQIIFPLDAKGIITTGWETNLPISMLTLGALTGGSKKSLSVNFACDLQLGKGVKNVTDPISVKPSGDDDRDPFTGDNTLYVGWGFGINGQVKLSWSRLIEPSPGQYDQRLSQDLQQDFANIIGIRNKDGLKRDIYKWLRTVLLNKTATMTAPNRDKVKSTIADLIKTGRPIVKSTDILSTLVSAVVEPDNPLLGTIKAFKSWQTQPATVKLIQRLQAYAHFLRQGRRPFSLEQTQQMTQIDWFIDQLYLQKPDKGAQAELFWWLYTNALSLTTNDTPAIQKQVKKSFPSDSSIKKYPSIKKQATDLKDALTKSTNANAQPFLQLINNLIVWIGRPTSRLLVNELTSFALQNNDQVLSAQATVFVTKINKVITDIQAQSANPNRNLTKIGSVTFPNWIDDKQGGKLTYYDLLSIEGEFGAETGPKLIVPLWAQVIVAGSAGVMVTGKIRGRKSGYRLQTLTMSRKNAGEPLIITQDTRMTYSQVELSGKVWGDMVATIAQPAITPSSLNQAYESTNRIEESVGKKVAKEVEDKIKGTLNVLNAFDYISTVAYWRYPVASGVKSVIVGRGSGLNLGCSILSKQLVKFVKNPGKSSSKKLAKTIRSYTGIEPAVLASFLTFANIEALERWEIMPESLLIEAGYAFPDGYEIFFNSGQKKRYEPKNLVATDDVQKMIEQIRGFKSNAPRPTVLRLRLRLADWLNDSNNYFKLGLWGNAFVGIKLRAIYEAEQSGIIDLCTFHLGKKGNIRNAAQPKPPTLPPENAVPNDQAYRQRLQQYNQQLADWEVAQESVVPPVGLLHQ